MPVRRAAAVAFVILMLSPVRAADDPAATVLQRLDGRSAAYAKVALQIWEWAELGFQETKSSALLQEQLRSAGFRMQVGVADMPTAFIAEWGRGTPVIGIFGEFDALPGLSQQARPDRAPVVDAGPGHGCGHHTFGVASAATAIAVKEWLEQTGTQGTIRYYGSPAEEGGGGKVYMIRDGFLKDVDTVIAWHPGDSNDASASSSMAMIMARFRFKGVSAHAAAAPERGRSALDGLEAMDYMVNMMREHVPQETRIHYAIFKGGQAPNVVPDDAEAEYVVRHPDMRVLEGIWDRVVQASKGAAMGTGTTAEHEVLSAYWNILPNETLARVQYRNLERVGGYRMSADEVAFAEALRATMVEPRLPIGSQEGVQPFRVGGAAASTDMGDVSWVVPTVQMRAAIFVPGAAAHSWQATASGGTGIAMKGMMVAAKTMTLTAMDLFRDPSIIARAKAEFAQKTGPGFTWRTRVGTRRPPYDFRK
jgi:aminobenzoyl-glutamate utilization protein B